MSRTRPARAHGSWASPFESSRVSEGSLRLSLPRLDRGDLYWLEGRASEGGRQAVVAARGAAGPADVTPPAVNVRTRVHEYGGGDYGVRDGVLVFRRAGTRWIEEARLLADEGFELDTAFGKTLAHDGDFVVAGAWREDGIGQASGRSETRRGCGTISNSRRRATRADGVGLAILVVTVRRTEYRRSRRTVP